MEVNDYQQNYSTGWISLYRSIQKHWIWNDEKFLKWWLIILFDVNHSENKINLGYNIYQINKGQSANSLRTWSNLFNTNTKSVTKFFILLEKDGMITKEIIGKGKQSTTLVTVVNYANYQGKNETQVTTLTTTQGKRKRDTNNNVNNVDNENKEKSFDFFWYTYPNKIAKSKCKSIFMKLKEDDIDKIVKTIKSYIAYKPFEDYNHPNPLTYLNQQRWNDEIKKETTTIHVSYPSN